MTEAPGEPGQLVIRRNVRSGCPLLWFPRISALGDTEHALDFLERAAEKQSAVILFTLFMPACLDPLRPEPRFQQVIRRIGLPM